MKSKSPKYQETCAKQRKIHSRTLARRGELEILLSLGAQLLQGTAGVRIMAIYKTGKAIVAKHEDHTTNAELIRTAAHGLYFLITEFRLYIKAAHDYDAAHPSSLDAGQISFLFTVHGNLHHFLNPRPLSGPKKNVITKALRTRVMQLKATFVAHKANEFLRELPSTLNSAAERLITATLEFTEAFVFLDGLIVDIKNRPTDWAVKRRVAAIIIRHQEKTNGNSFPKFPMVMSALNRYRRGRKHQLSARNYGNLKQQWQCGTYWHFIQP